MNHAILWIHNLQNYPNHVNVSFENSAPYGELKLLGTERHLYLAQEQIKLNLLQLRDYKSDFSSAYF